MTTFGQDMEGLKEDGHEVRTVQRVHDSRLFRRSER